MPENQEPKYLTPYVSGVNELGANTEEIGKFIAKVLKLPKNVQNIFRNFSTAEFMTDNLASSFRLNAGQTEELTRILRDILLTDLFWGDFPKTVSARLQIPPDTAIQIVKEITDKLLTPALEEIKAMQKEKFGNRISQNQSNQTQTQPPQQYINPEQGNVINLRNQK